MHGVRRFEKEKHMSRVMLVDWSHPVLGTFARSTFTNHLNETSVYLEKKRETTIAGLGFTFGQFRIFLREVSEPPSAMVSDLVAIVQWPSARLHEIQERMFQYYVDNRSQFIELNEEYGMPSGEIARRVPIVERAADVWGLIESPKSIHASTGDQISISFECTFDFEHELHISFLNAGVERVWNE
jgi:hypothetical protein